MADTKISALTVATTPLAGTEVLPIVQSGVTKQVSIANLTAGRAVSAASLTLTSTPLAATSGGTGLASFAVGDILYASTTTALSALADVATGNALISGGVGVAPSWGKIGLATHVSGTLPVGNGGTGLTSYTLNGIPYASGTGTLTTSTNLTFDGTNFFAVGQVLSATTKTTGLSTVTQITTLNSTGNLTTGSTYDIPLNGDRTGIIVIRENVATGYWALYGFSTDDGNGTVVISKTPASTWGTSAGGVVGTNVYPSGSNLRIQNNSGGTRGYKWNWLTIPT